VPVLLREVMDALRPRPGDVVADCTLGYGGHAAEFLRRIEPGGRLIGLDVDAEQLERTRQRLAAIATDQVRFSVHRSNFAGLGKVMAAERLDAFDIIFADLGVSSMQIDDPARGFSYKHEGPLDMRMDLRLRRTAAELLATLPRDELAAALRELADEPDARRIADEVVAMRARRPLRHTSELVDAVLRAKGIPHVRQRGDERPADAEHPAARTFQALRIVVNDELGGLKALLRIAPYCLRLGGRIGIISFHSGEDRMVKRAFADGLRGGVYSAIADTPTRPGSTERRDNPRSAPAKLRWAIAAAGTEVP